MTEPLITGHDAALGAIAVIFALVVLAIYAFIEREIANHKGKEMFRAISNDSPEFMNQLAEDFTRDPDSLPDAAAQASRAATRFHIAGSPDVVGERPQRDEARPDESPLPNTVDASDPCAREFRLTA